MNITGILISIWRGFIDSLRGVFVLFSMDKQINDRMKKSTSRTDPRRKEIGVGHSPAKYSKHHRESKVLKRTIQCCALNGGVCWTSMLVFEYGLLTLLKYLLATMFGESTGEDSTWSRTRSFLTFTFEAIWVLPIFFLSKVINSLWFQDIADSAYRYRQGRPMLLSSISKLIADMLFSVLVQLLFLSQGFLLSKVPLPPIGDALALIHKCLLYALYAFEYKWFNMGWELHRRLEFIECNWPYFIGFGLPLAISTRLPNSYVGSGCAFSILFPLFIISGNEAEPVTNLCDCPLKLFSPAVAIANILFTKIMGPINRRWHKNISSETDKNIQDGKNF